MSRLTAAEFREKHARRLKAAGEDIRRGIDRVTEAPTLKAAAKIDKMRAKLNEAIDSGKVERGLKRVSLEDWKEQILNKGVGRIPAGVDGAAQKIETFAGELLAFQDNIKKKVDAMPDMTLDDNIQRMTTQIREQAKFKRS